MAAIAGAVCNQKQQNIMFDEIVAVAKEVGISVVYPT
jgi:hypothetical protein